MESDLMIKFNYSYLCENRDTQPYVSIRDKPYGLVKEKILDSIEIKCSDALKYILASKETLSDAYDHQELNEQAPKWLVLFKKVDELELSVRSQNLLKNDNIVYIGDLVIKTEAEMLITPNFGRKSLNEIKERLAEYKLKFGMEVPNWPVYHLLDIAKDLFYNQDYEEILLPAIKSYLKSHESYTRL